MLRGVVEQVVEVMWLVSKCPSHRGAGYGEDLGKIGRGDYRVLLLGVQITEARILWRSSGGRVINDMVVCERCLWVGTKRAPFIPGSSL